MLAFESPGRPPVLHCGDCRYERNTFQGNATLQSLRHRAILHLDTTYCAPQHCFPLQAEVVDAVVALCQREYGAVQSGGGKPPLFAFGSYTIGKERLFLEVLPVSCMRCMPPTYSDGVIVHCCFACNRPTDCPWMHVSALHMWPVQLLVLLHENTRFN